VSKTPLYATMKKIISKTTLFETLYKDEIKFLMRKRKYIPFALILVLAVSTVSCNYSKSEIKVEEVYNLKMINPETVVKSFIEDYFLWNKQAFDRANQLQTSEKSELSAIGITEPILPDQIKNTSQTSQYIEIKGKYSNENIKLLGQIDSEYKKIIEKYCRPNYQHLNVAFGSESAHDPKNEAIVSVETDNIKSVVKTQLMRELIGNTKYTDDYEYHLTFENNRWYLEQIYYVTKEGRYEGL
jgi:hypothetical protein